MRERWKLRKRRDDNGGCVGRSGVEIAVHMPAAVEVVDERPGKMYMLRTELALWTGLYSRHEGHVLRGLESAVRGWVYFIPSD